MSTKHGMFGTNVYAVWASMKQRCLNPKHRAYHRYGGRGITVCKKWMTFEGFYTDMGDPPIGMSLERRRNHQGYSKANCHWATPHAQAQNRDTCVVLKHAGRTMNVTQWAEHLGIPRMRIYKRLEAGWPVAKVLTQPRRGTK